MDLYTSLTPFALAFIALAAVVATLGLAVVGEFVVRNRRVRLARHESIRTYYGGLALTH
jgi:hypothetical protein